MSFKTITELSQLDRVEIDSTDEIMIYDKSLGLTKKSSANDFIRAHKIDIAGKDVSLSDHVKNNRVVNVRDYGAVGDNVTADQAAFNDALNHADYHRTVFVPDGEYYLGGAAYVKSNTTLKSDGRAKLRSRYLMIEQDAENIVIDGFEFDGETDSWMYGIRLYYGGQKNIIIRNCKFTGNAIITQDWDPATSVLAENITIEKCEFEFDASVVQNNVDVIKLYGKNITVRDCKFNVTNSDEVFKFAGNSENITIENCDIVAAPGEEVIDVYQTKGPVRFINNVLTVSTGGILRAKPGDSINQYPYPYEILFSGNTIEYTGSTDNLIYIAGAYTLSWAPSTEQKVTISNNTIKHTTMPTCIRVTGVHKAIISGNKIESENPSDSAAIYLSAIKELTVSGNIVGTGYIIGYPTNTPAGESYASSYTGVWTISGNTITSDAPSPIDGIIYIYNQNIDAININGNTIGVASNQIGRAIRIRNSTVEHVSVSNNVIPAYDGGYNQYAKVDLKDSTITNLRVDNKGQNIINVRDFGAVGDGITDDTAAIQSAIDYATQYNETLYSGVIGSKARVYAEGTFKITSTVTVTCDVDMHNATFVVPSSFASTAIKVEASDGLSYLQLNDTYLPTVKVESMVDNWVNTNIGIQITSVTDSKIHFGEVWYFQTGIVLTTWENKGLSYNDFYLNSIRNNKVGLHIYPATGGWTNDNNFYGGRIRIDSGYSDYTGTILLHLTGNNNVFYKPVLEGNYDETKIWLDGNSYGYGCAYNKFINPRPESSSTWRLVVDGSSCTKNSIIDGYISSFSDINYVVQNSAPSDAINFVVSGEMIKSGTDQYGVLKLQNKTSDSYPIVSLYSLNYDPKVDPDKPTSKITSTGFEFKANYSYTNPYIKADPALKALVFPRNALDPANAPYIRSDYDTEWYLSVYGNGKPIKIDSMRLELQNHSYSNNQLVLGSYYIWVDASGNLRIKNGAPTSDTDGTIVGTQS